jgi:hypothetical protein
MGPHALFRIQGLLKLMLRPAIIALVYTFDQKVEQLGLQCDLSPAVDEDPYYDIDRVNTLIETEVERLKPNQLARMHAQLKSLELRASTPDEDRMDLVGIILNFFNQDKLIQLMHSHLNSFLKSDGPHSALVQLVIDELSNRLPMALQSNDYE